MRSLQDVPGHGSRVHPAAQHGDHVGGENKSQRTLGKTGAHRSTLAEGAGMHHGSREAGHCSCTQLRSALRCACSKLRFHLCVTRRQAMRRCSGSLLAVIFFSLFVFQANAQIDHISIAAGTDEDKALQAITAEQDVQKKLAMYEDFVQKFSANPSAVAYGNWQIAQAYQGTGDFQKALDYGDKALVGSPRNLDILVMQASLGQQAKNNSKLMDYAAKGGEVCHSIGKQAKPDGV